MSSARMLVGAGSMMAVVAVLLAVVAIGCPGPVGTVTYCDYPDFNNMYQGVHDPCHCADDAGSVGIISDGYCAGWWAQFDAGDASARADPPPCNGTCLPLPPLGWSEPALVYAGVELGAPGCPEIAPVAGYEGHADLSAPNTCGACSCEPPSGACALPATIVANAAPCPGTSAVHTPWDPPAPWDGTCDAYTSIAAGKLCAGAKCVQSVTIGPLTLTEETCAAVTQPVPQKTAAVWGTYGLACIGSTVGECEDHATVCAAVPAMPPEGFGACIFHEGDVECPGESPYSDKNVFYGGVADTRDCSPCGCGAPEGSGCEALVSVFADGACGAEILSDMVTAAGPACADVPAGSALGSKAAASPTYTPGVCPASGGEPIGEAVPAGAVTFCCLPPGAGAE